MNEAPSLYTPVFLPGEFHEQRSLVSYSPWDDKESGMAEPLKLSFPLCRQEKQGTWKILSGGSGSGRKIEWHGLHVPGMSNAQSHCFRLCKGQVSEFSQSNSGFSRSNMKPEIDLLSAQSPHCFPKFLGDSVTLFFSH